MAGKTDKQFFFEVELTSGGDGDGYLRIKDVEPVITTGTPPPFGGDEKKWSAVHLFLASVSNDFLMTLAAFSAKAGIVISRFSCTAIGQIEIVHHKYRFTNINLYPKIRIQNARQQKKMEEIVEKTNRNCLIINSLNVNVFFHTQTEGDDGQAIGKGE